MRHSAVSQPRPRPSRHRGHSNVVIIGERFFVRFKDKDNNRVMKDVKLQSVSEPRARKLGESVLKTLKENGNDVDGIKVNVVGVVVR